MSRFAEEAFMKHSSGARKTVNLSESVNRHLAMYARGATAAGVSMLALAQPADAKVIYTPAHARVQASNTPYCLDFGVTVVRPVCDFGIKVYYGNEGTNIFLSSVGVQPYTEGNGIVATVDQQAAALRSGAKIGPANHFRGPRFGIMAQHRISSQYHMSTWRGPWIKDSRGLKDRYLGLKFIHTDGIHFGWARFSIVIGKTGLQAVLNGYAYETIPNKPIIAGETRGADTVLPEADATPATLGKLAQGRK